jgi:hypothetical protein
MVVGLSMSPAHKYARKFGRSHIHIWPEFVSCVPRHLRRKHALDGLKKWAVSEDTKPVVSSIPEQRMTIWTNDDTR